jgi:hypothetical protein
MKHEVIILSAVFILLHIAYSCKILTCGVGNSSATMVGELFGRVVLDLEAETLDIATSLSFILF